MSVDEGGPVERLRLTATQLEEVVDHLRAALPDEACGLLAIGDDDRVRRRYPISNIAERPRTRYLGEPLELLEAFLDMEAAGWRLGAIYHSHPTGPAWPSAEDLRQAHYPTALTLLISLTRPEQPEVRLFSLRDGRIDERPLRVEADAGMGE